MPTVVVFDFVNSDSGYVQKTGSNYAFAVGWDKCDIDKKPLLSQEKRTILRFDTSALPDNAIISVVEFFRVDRESLGTPVATATDVKLGAWCGASLDASANDFSGGTSLVLDILGYTAETWINLGDMGIEPGPLINRTGITDLAILNLTPGSANSFYGFNANRAKCRLRVTYTVPSATATGRGTASASATVVVAGAATAIGRGTAQASATVRSVGSSIVTGRGMAQLVAFVIAAGFGTVTGRGSAEAIVTITAVGSSAATGRGTAQASAAITALGSAVGTGRATAEMIAAVIVTGAATATGQGTAAVTAAVAVFASAEATGRATASCDGHLEEGTASATATGRGFAACHLTVVHFDPLARHFATRAVRVTDAARRAVSGVHRASRACDPADARLCGARRWS